jgi:hypothetical protein
MTDRDSSSLYTASGFTDVRRTARLAELTAAGSVNRIAHVRSDEKPRWAWRVANRRDTCHVLDAIHPLLGERRKASANYALSIGRAS